MQAHEVLGRMKALKLHGMAGSFEEIVEGAIKKKISPYDLLGNHRTSGRMSDIWT